MSKTILILDKKPKYCSDCPLNKKVTSFLHGARYVCGKTGEYNNNFPFVPKWCPLKELPDKIDEDEEDFKRGSFWHKLSVGWNACLDKICGEGDLLRDSCADICEKQNTCHDCPIQKAFNKLAYYEDLEEKKEED